MPALALTFDDGPDPEGTPAVLGALAEQRIHGTFFFLTERARRFPELVREVGQAGHEIGLHGDVHEAMDRVPARALLDRLNRAKDELSTLTGLPVTFHRPPFGRLSLTALRASSRAGLVVAMWSHDPRDWEDQSDQQLLSAMAGCVEPGAIVLLHDGACQGQGNRTARALREHLPSISGAGLSAVTLTGLL